MNLLEPDDPVGVWCSVEVYQRVTEVDGVVRVKIRREVTEMPEEADDEHE